MRAKTELKKLIKEFEDKEPKTPLSVEVASGHHNAELIFIHHLDKPTKAFIEAIVNSYKIKLIIGIPYSSKDDVVNELSKTFRVIVPDSLNDIKNIIRNEVEASKENIIIQEIGGYTTEIANFLDSRDNVLGVVEDTNQGHWLWEKTALKRLSVMSIAQSNIKRFEEPFVGKAIVYGINKFLITSGLPGLNKRRVLVLGYGNIGRWTSKALVPICKDLMVFDVDPIKMLQASIDGFVTSRDLSSADVIIGVTGNINHSVIKDDLVEIKDNTYLFSGSSKTVEFDLDGFKTLANLIERDGNLIYEFNNKKITVANFGEPINLRYISLPSRILDLVFASLTLCANKIDQGAAPPGLSTLKYEDQKELVKQYLRKYSS